MSSISKSFQALSLIFIIFMITPINGQLSSKFYANTCPNVEQIVRSVMNQNANFFGASILRLFFHDCFVNGCDGSVLLDDTPTSRGEKNAPPNANSLRGFQVIDTIKSSVEKACNATVSCADILALAARDSVNLLGGPTWTVLLGRKDSKTASFQAAINNLPSADASLSALFSLYGFKGLNPQDLTALSGAHTIGLAHCKNFRSHIYNDKNVNASFAALRKMSCPRVGGDNNLSPMDIISSNRFDNGYFKNLVVHKGLFHSDQELYNGGSQDSLVKKYSDNVGAFFNDFVSAMIKMGNMRPPAGQIGEIRLNCRKKN